MTSNASIIPKGLRQKPLLLSITPFGISKKKRIMLSSNISDASAKRENCASFGKKTGMIFQHEKMKLLNHDHFT